MSIVENMLGIMYKEGALMNKSSKSHHALNTNYIPRFLWFLVCEILLKIPA